MYQFFKLTLRTNVCGLLACGRNPDHGSAEAGTGESPTIVIHTEHTQIAPKENERNTQKIVL